MIRTLQAATGDVVVVATVPTIEPYGDIREYAIKLFENHGKGIGQKGKDNGAADPARAEGAPRLDRGRLRPRAVDHRRLRRRDQPRRDERRCSAAAITAPGCSPAPSGSSAASRRAATSRSTACACRAQTARERAIVELPGVAPDRHLHRHPHHQPHRRRRRRGAAAAGAAAAGAAGRAASVRSAAASAADSAAAVAAVDSAAASAGSAAAAAAAAAAAPAGRIELYADDTQNSDANGRARARGAAADRLFVQHVRQPGRGDQGAVGAGREPAAAAQRPDPEPGRDDQGLRAARGGRLQGHRRRAIEAAGGQVARGNDRRRPISRRRRSAGCSRSSRTIRS